MTEVMIGSRGAARFSPCKAYRYTLWRWWDRSKGFAQFIGLNPSTADENIDDPTVRRCIRYAKDLGYGGMCMTNAFAYRATDPRDMKLQADPIGPDNDNTLIEIAALSNIVIACWGTHGCFMDREAQIVALALKHKINLHALAETQNGRPGHPLYLKASLVPKPWSRITELRELAP